MAVSLKNKTVSMLGLTRQQYCLDLLWNIYMIVIIDSAWMLLFYTLYIQQSYTHTHTHTHHRICLVSWSCRIHQLHLCRGTTPNECPGYDTKQFDGEVPVMLEFWGMRSTPSSLSLPGPLWPGVVAPDRILSMDQIELNCVLMLNWIISNRTVFTLTLYYTKLNCLK